MIENYSNILANSDLGISPLILLHPWVSIPIFCTIAAPIISFSQKRNKPFLGTRKREGIVTNKLETSRGVDKQPITFYGIRCSKGCLEGYMTGKHQGLELGDEIEFEIDRFGNGTMGFLDIKEIREDGLVSLSRIRLPFRQIRNYKVKERNQEVKPLREYCFDGNEPF